MILNSPQGPVPFTLPLTDKAAVEGLLRKAGEDIPRQREDFARRFTDGQHPAWRRYIDGIYNHPKTWWIGIIQTQMVLGVWGARRKAEASIRQAALAQVLHQLTAPENREQSFPTRRSSDLRTVSNLIRSSSRRFVSTSSTAKRI